MATIEIPFSREMAFAAIEGRKVATTRSEPKGEIGDVFTLQYPPGLGGDYPFKYRLLEIMVVDLITVRDLYFRLEGFESPAAFEKTWRALHRGHFTQGKLYYMHFFGRVA